MLKIVFNPKTKLWPIFIAILLPGLAQEADIYPLITYTCNPAENLLKIKNEIRYDEEGRKIVYDAKQGTYNPWDWVDIVKISEGNRLINKKPPIELTCQLGQFNYRILLEAKVFNRNYDGNCGNRISAVATIFRGGNLLLDHKEFESYCHGNTPVVRGVRVSGEGGNLEVVMVPKYQFY